MSQTSKKLASALLQGSRLLSDACPQCGSPLVQRRSGEVYCVNCSKKVVIATSDADAMNRAALPSVLLDLEEAIIERMKGLTAKIRTGDADINVLETAALMLEVFKRIKELEQEKR